MIAVRAMLQVIDAGGQAALLAPTEVLAQQHSRSVSDLLGPLGQAGRLGGAAVATRVALLTGSQPAAARRCAELGIAVIAHSPRLGGPSRAGTLGKRFPVLADAANELAATPAEVALAWLLGLDPKLVAILGARRPETARSAARAATLAIGPKTGAATAAPSAASPAAARQARAADRHHRRRRSCS